MLSFNSFSDNFRSSHRYFRYRSEIYRKLWHLNMLHACRIADINFNNNIFYTLNSRKKGKQFIYSMLNRSTIFFNVKAMYWLKAPIPRVDLIVKGKIAWPAWHDGSPDDLSRQIEWTAIRSRYSTTIYSNNFGFILSMPPFLSSRYTIHEEGGLKILFNRLWYRVHTNVSFLHF